MQSVVKFHINLRFGLTESNVCTEANVYISYLWQPDEGCAQSTCVRRDYHCRGLLQRTQSELRNNWVMNKNKVKRNIPKIYAFAAVVWSTHVPRKIGRLLPEPILTKYPWNWFHRDNPVEAAKLPSTTALVYLSLLLFMTQLSLIWIFLVK